MHTLIAGRELDAVVAEKVMGWHPATPQFPHWYPPNLRPESNALGHTMPAYSTDIAAAWTVVERLITSKQWTQFTLIEHEGQWKIWDYHFGPEEDKDSDYLASATTVPLAICLAALKAVGYKEPT